MDSMFLYKNNNLTLNFVHDTNTKDKFSRENAITEDSGVRENDIVCPQSTILISDSSMVDLNMQGEENYTGEVFAVANETMTMITMLVKFQKLALLVNAQNPQ